ncbi:MAG: Gfo/Idh/MocA family oxidoreductase [Ruminiclostridium sp.]|nr:Gfo/Idh/MocA family oxidoreductase [Ruminiclostridium sp.]
MKCVIVGYGSIGQRHARILRQLGCSVAVVSRRDIQFPLAYRSLPAALEQEKPDYVVIANKTGEHYNSLTQLAGCAFKGIVLVEKPLFHAAMDIPENCFKKAYVAYNLRFHPIIGKISEIVGRESTLYVQVYVGQYLPDWRPERDYRTVYSAGRDEGGGVLLDLSHELDYLHLLFGDWDSMAAIGGRYGPLEIDSDDMYSMMLTMKKCPMVQLHVNYLDRIGRREITVITENNTLKADLMQQTLQINKDIIHYRLERDYTYHMQHKAVINGEAEPLCTLEKGLAVLEMIRSAEQSARQRMWVDK